MPTCLLQTHCRLDSNQRAARADPRPLDDYEFLRVITSQYGCYLQITLTICKHTNADSYGDLSDIAGKSMCLHMVGAQGLEP